MKQEVWNRLMLAMLYVCRVVGALFFLTLYWTLPYILRLEPSAATGGARYVVSLTCWYIGAAGANVLLHILTRMARSLFSDPFVRQNVLDMRRMGAIAIGMSLCSFVAAALYEFRALLVLIGMMEVFCAMLSLVLSGVFEKAVEYKDENELVI